MGTNEGMKNMSSWSGPSDAYWLHCIGPDGLVVLLTTYSSRTRMFTLHDDGDRAAPMSENGWVHKWRVYRIDPIERPAPALVS